MHKAAEMLQWEQCQISFNIWSAAKEGEGGEICFRHFQNLIQLRQLSHHLKRLSTPQEERWSGTRD